MFNVEERVQRGIDKLNESVPDWRKRVNPDKLSLSTVIRCSDGLGCPLAQLYGNYVDGLEAIGLYATNINPADYGFEANTLKQPEYDALTAEWQRRIRWSLKGA
jgi:hypothetical protein